MATPGSILTSTECPVTRAVRMQLDVCDSSRITDPVERMRLIANTLRRVGSPSFNDAAAQIERVYYYAPPKCVSCGK